MYCKNCGRKISKKTKTCPFCGASQKKASNKSNSLEFSISIWWTLIGFIIPVAGFVLSIAWRKDDPKASRSLMIGFALNTLLQIFLNFALPVN